MDKSHIKNLGPRGEQILESNLQTGEEILIKLRGNFGQALVLTDKHIYIPKWGFMTGNTFGSKCMVFSYNNIIGIDIKKGIADNTLTILSSATRNNPLLSYWGRGSRDAKKSDYAVTFRQQDFSLFQYAANLGRELVNKYNHYTAPMNNLDSLEKLAKLKDKGILTEEEFSIKKKELLGI